MRLSLMFQPRLPNSVKARPHERSTGMTASCIFPSLICFVFPARSNCISASRTKHATEYLVKLSFCSRCNVMPQTTCRPAI